MKATKPMQVGKRYEITYQLDNQRYPRSVVGTYLGSYLGQDAMLDLRPSAGTAHLPYSSLIDWVETNEAHRQPRRA